MPQRSPAVPLFLRRGAMCCALALGALAGPAWAEQPAPAGLLRLQAQASAEVVPDRSVASLAAVAQGDDLAALNADVAQRLDAALRSARAVQGVQASTGEVSTQPRFRDVGGTVRQDGWTVSAVLTLRTADPDKLGVLLGELGKTLQLQSVHGEMSATQRQHELDTLGARAIAAFRARAQAAAREFGYAGYTLGEVQLSDLQGAEPQSRPMMLQQGMLGARAAQPAMAVQPGRREVSVSVNGSVQLVH
ncbi:SIMPL domain-containing protein [Thiomonas sp.]|uniref:SIMPL domain-containing protein n=1 Tax=Thiomonas sp. TaxID=2047785 RepID=UPI00262C05CD|nr:SIMPL domain-containing protein [Thiomonas sp.]